MALLTEITSLLHLARPVWLLALAAAAIPPVIAALARGRGKHTGLRSVALQCLAVALAVCALAEPSVPVGLRAEKPWMVLQDASASATSQPAGTISWPAHLRRENYLFAQNVTQRRDDQQPAEGFDANGTRIATSLQLAASRAETLAGLVVLTDGQFQDSDWPALAQALGRLHLPVFIVPLDSPPADARLADLTAHRRSDGRVDLAATILSNAVQKRTVVVSCRDGRELLRKELTLLPNEPAVVHAVDDVPGTGAVVYQARLLGRDAFPQNDSASTLLAPSSQHVALIGRDIAPLAAALPGQLKFPVTALPPEQAPRDAADWMNYSAVILVDANGSLLTAPQRTTLGQYVRDGGGLVLVGAGPYAAPSDRDDGLNRVAALAANPYQRRPMRVVVVLDASGSMSEPAVGAPGGGGQTKFEAASQAVLALQRHLTRADSLAVITYSDTAQVVYDSNSAPADFGALREALAAVVPGGPTKVMPALALAAQTPAPVDKQGLVLLASDLLTEPLDAAEVGQAEALFARGRYSLSVAAVRGSQAESQPAQTSLQVLTDRLKAQRLACDDLRGLADVFGQFLRSSRGEAVQKGKFVPHLENGAMGLTGLTVPELDSYILCAPQEQAQVLGTVGADPLLARRQVGLGRSVSLAMPLGEGANAALMHSDALPQLLTAALRWASREQADGRFAGQVQREGDKLRVMLDGADANGPMNLLELSVMVSGKVSGALKQTAPGRYQAGLAVPAGPAEVVVKQSPGDHVVYRQSVGQECESEFAAIGPNWENLRRLAELTGGQVASVNQLPTLSARWDRQRFTPIWPYLLAAALALALADWCLCRVLRKTRSQYLG